MALSTPIELEQKIYEAAFVPELWPGVLDELGQMAGALGAVAFGVVDATANWTSSSAISDAMAAFISEGWYARNTRSQIGFMKKLDTQPRFVTERDMFDGDGFLGEPIYKEFFIPRGMGWHAGTVINALHGDRLIVSVEKPLASGPVSSRAVASLNRLRPHLARAAMVATRLAFERARTAVDTLAVLGLPAFGINGKGRLTLTNALFDVSAGLWTTKGGDSLVLADRRAQRLVGSALDGIQGPNGIRSIPLVSERDDEPAILHLVPVRRSAHDLFSGSAAIGLISQRSANTPHSVQVLQALFDLTPTEARVALKVAAGRSIEQIATDDKRSIETIRGHIKNVQAKTGCRRQVELAALLPQLLLPYRAT